LMPEHTASFRNRLLHYRFGIPLCEVIRFEWQGMLRPGSVYVGVFQALRFMDCESRFVLRVSVGLLALHGVTGGVVGFSGRNLRFLRGLRRHRHYPACPCVTSIVPSIAVLVMSSLSLGACIPCWIASRCLHSQHTSYVGGNELRATSVFPYEAGHWCNSDNVTVALCPHRSMPGRDRAVSLLL
jgi:hypothetical protein